MSRTPQRVARPPRPPRIPREPRESRAPRDPRLARSSPIILIGGGVRSGKSAFALERGLSLGARRAFIATAQPFDDDMRIRIERHAAERGDAFCTIEAPLELCRAVEAIDDVDVLVIDCLTLWLSNLLLRGDGEPDIDREVCALVETLRSRKFPVIVVTNEVGMGVVPDSALGRTFRDVSGRAHQRLAKVAGEIYVALVGCVLRLRPSPVSLANAVEGGP